MRRSFALSLLLLHLLIVFAAVSTLAQDDGQLLEDDASDLGAASDRPVPRPLKPSEDDDDEFLGFQKSSLHPGARLVKECPEPGAPTVGSIVTLHVPDVGHLIPRFHGLRVFAPTDEDKYEREDGHIKKHSHDVFNEHHRAKVLYAFDEHAVQAIWPVHAYGHGGRNLRVKLTDLFVIEDYPHTAHGAQDKSAGKITMCFFKASFF